MGHEIVYCYWCSGRILGADFEKGNAVLIGNHACCSECRPKILASLPPPAPSRAPPRITPRGMPAVSSPSKAPKSQSLMIGLIVGGLVVAGLTILVLGGGGKKEEPRRVEAPPPPKTDAPDRGREALQKARDAARAGIDIDQQAKLWDEALARTQGTPLRDEVARDHAAFLERRKEVIAQELTRLLDNVDTLIKDIEWRKALDILSSARNRRSVPEWAAAIDRKTEEVRKAEAGGAPYRQDAEGLVVIEAERFHQKSDVGEHAWAPVTAPAGFSGTGAMAALPNKNANWQKDFLTVSPRLDFRVLFVKTGVHYVWVRGHQANGADDSVHLGLDGKEVPAATGTLVGGKWSWTRRTMSNKDSSIPIAAAGLHTVNLWMREDGAIIDRIVLTTDSKYVPKDAGPPESLR
jgi:hypothetical protein